MSTFEDDWVILDVCGKEFQMLKRRISKLEPKSDLARIFDVNVDPQELSNETDLKLFFNSKNGKWLLSAEPEYFMYIARYFNTGTLSGFRSDHSPDVLLTYAKLLKLDNFYQSCRDQFKDHIAQTKQSTSPSPIISLDDVGSSTSSSNIHQLQPHSFKFSNLEMDKSRSSTSSKRPDCETISVVEQKKRKQIIPPEPSEWVQYSPETFIEKANLFFQFNDFIQCAANLWMAASYIVKLLFLPQKINIVSHVALKQCFVYAVVNSPLVYSKKEAEEAFAHFNMSEELHRFTYGKRLTKKVFEENKEEVIKMIKKFTKIKTINKQQFLTSPEIKWKIDSGKILMNGRDYEYDKSIY